MPELQVNGARLHYRVDGPGDGTPVVLSNSLASNLTMWDLQVEPLEMEGFRVIRYDSRGHGRSDAPEGPYSMELLTDDAAALIDHLDLGPVHLCGLSKGGMVAQMMGSRHPERVKSLCIADSAAFMPAKDVWEQRIAMVREGGMRAVVDATVDRWFTKPGQLRIPDEVEKVRAMILATPPAGFIACGQAIKTMDLRDSIRTITAPSLVICGEEDTGTTPAQAREIAESIPGAVLELIPHAAHFVNVEQPAAFTNALLKHLIEHR